jgi:predicted alpha/beta hydrolase family esterase
MKNKTQILFIHGGMTFKNKKDYLEFLKLREVSMGKKVKWSDDYLDKKLGKNFEITRPRMPLQDNAKYEEWKIHFERYIPHLQNGTILIGNSLGGIFLAQYLSENELPKKLGGVFLVCPPFDGSLSSEDLVGGFRLQSDLSLLAKSTKNLYLLFSANDDVVPVEHAHKYKDKLPNANIIIYKDKNGHFQVPEFPEIVKLIKTI